MVRGRRWQVQSVDGGEGGTRPVANDRSILITNGNLLSLVSLADWLRRYGSSIAKIYVTRRLPSERSNVAGVMRMLRRSGLDYTYFKVWLNVVPPGA